MSTNGDHEMADAVVGAEVDAADVELTEPQRIRVVSILSMLFSI
jgi:DNA-directed RNA polymerase I and III subunit RPAC2